MLTRRFRDRRDAGRQLAERLSVAAGDAVVLALPRGGVPVGAEIARALICPLDVLIVRKLGVPARPELGFGALAEGGIRILNRDLIDQLELTEETIERVAAREAAEVDRRTVTYRDGRAMVDVEGKTVVVVDDGIATGFTAEAAIEALRSMAPARIVLAVPVAPPSRVDELREVADEVVALVTPASFMAVGEWYDDFTQVSDRQVAELLSEP